MGYQSHQRTGTSKGFEKPRRIRSKTKTENPRLNETYSREQTVQSLNEVVSRTLNSLHNLGTQKFALASFHEYFERWLMNLHTVLTDFESSQAVAVDEKFRQECSQIFSNIELALTDKSLKESSESEIFQRLLNSKNMLSQIEQEHTSEMKEITEKREHTTKPLVDKIDAFEQELHSIQNMKTGFFVGISKKTKAQKEEDATLRLIAAKKELEEIEKSFATTEMSHREEYERRRQEILEQITRDQKEIERFDSQIDSSAEVRRIACENLADVVKALLKRIETVSEKTEPST
jgi:hypothetical protein